MASPSSGGSTPPVILLGGYANALSIARSLGRRGIDVVAVTEAGSAALRSRFCTERHPLPEGASPREHWRELLLDTHLERWRGAVLFPCEDNGIQTVASSYQELSRHYLVDEYEPELWLAMLDKRRTLELAAKAGCHVPRHFEIRVEDDVATAMEELQFPMLLKPIHSHLFKARFHVKLFVVQTPSELEARAADVLAHGLEVMAMELVPGPDTALSSYYTHLSKEGEHLFHFTKRMIRRSPPRVGVGCYHVTEWLPETAEMGRRFFRGIGFTGLGNIEFKRDPRDGKLKVIECNARFTEAQELITRSGLDMAYLIYRYLAGTPLEPPATTRDFLHLWYPEHDFDSFRALRAEGALTFAEWLRSVAHRQVFPYFQWTDPAPGLWLVSRSLRERLGRRLGGRLKRLLGG